MKAINTFIFDILANDIESLEIIEAELNNHSIPEHSIHIQNDDFFLKQNHRQKFTWDEIKTVLKQLIILKYIILKVLDNKSNSIKKIEYSDSLFQLDPGLLWFELTKKGEEYLKRFDQAS